MRELPQSTPETTTEKIARLRKIIAEAEKSLDGSSWEPDQRVQIERAIQANRDALALLEQS